MKLVIGNKNYSSWSLRPWLLMRLKSIAFEETLIPLYEPDSKAKQLAFGAAGKLPILIDGGTTVWDSLAIVEYLAERFPGLHLWPRDPVARARARCLCAEMHSGFGALRSKMPMNLRASHSGRGRTPEVLADIARITSLWEDCLAEFADEKTPFLFGEFSAADAFFAPVATRFETYAVPLSPACQRYVATLRGLPAMQEWTAAAAVEPWRIAASEIDADAP